MLQGKGVYACNKLLVVHTLQRTCALSCGDDTGDSYRLQTGDVKTPLKLQGWLGFLDDNQTCKWVMQHRVCVRIGTLSQELLFEC